MDSPVLLFAAMAAIGIACAAFAIYRAKRATEPPSLGRNALAVSPQFVLSAWLFIANKPLGFVATSVAAVVAIAASIGLYTLAHKRGR